METYKCSLEKIESSHKKIDRTLIVGMCSSKPAIGSRFNIFSERPEDKGGMSTSPIEVITPFEEGLLLLTENSIYLYRELKNEDSTASNYSDNG